MARFQTTFKKTLGTLIAIGILIGLGTWQMQRREEKTQMIATVQERTTQAPMNQLPVAQDYGTLEFRRIVMTGLLDNSKFLFVGPRTQNGKSGYYMYVPMILQDRRVILVNKGFVENQYISSVRTGSSAIEAVSGVIRKPAGKGYFTPDNDVTGTSRTYYWLDVAAIGQRLGYPQLLPVTVDLDNVAGASYSQANATPLVQENNHLQYALTWYGLALIAAIFYLISSFRAQTVIEPGFRRVNNNLEQGTPFGHSRGSVNRGNANQPKPFKDPSNDGPSSLW